MARVAPVTRSNSPLYGVPRGVADYMQRAQSSSEEHGLDMLRRDGVQFIKPEEPVFTKATAMLGAAFFFAAGAVAAWAVGLRHPSQARAAPFEGTIVIDAGADFTAPTPQSNIAMAAVAGEMQIDISKEQVKDKAVERLALFEKLWEEQQARYAAQSEPITVTLPNGGSVEAQSWVTTPMDIAEGISKGLAKKAIVAKVDGELWDMGRPLEGDCMVEILDYEDPEAKEVFQHSSAHVLGYAMEDTLGCLLTTGPPLEDGSFFYEADCLKDTVGKGEYNPLEAACKKLVKQSAPYQRLAVDKEDAIKMFDYNPYKANILRSKVPDGGQCIVYRCGDFVDPCRGPHIPNTNAVKALAVTKNSSSYWQGKADQQTLQRVYGIAFPKASMLKEWQELMAKAEQNDHRNIGKRQGLWMFHPASPGACFFHPHGARIYNGLIEFIKKQYRVREFEEVITPNLFNSSLWKQSGHWDNYKEDMFSVEIEEEIHSLKPMNCPSHMLMFGSQRRSYRELPMRFADFGVLHRNEVSGSLTGLTRVRRFQQDDAHIFIRRDQIKDEISSQLEFLAYVYEVFGFPFYLNLSTRNPEKWLGELPVWDDAESRLAEAMNIFCNVPKEFEWQGETITYDGTPACIKKLKLAVKAGNYPEPKQYWVLNPEDAAFYGPKIDIQLEDCMKRRHQCGTIQLDFNLPERFKLTYTMSPEEKAFRESEGMGGGVDGVEDYARPVVVHRAILGSVERMIAVLTEHWEGKWPLWISPRQACVIPLAHEFDDYAIEVKQKLKAAGYYVEADIGNDQFKKKVRTAQQEQYNFLLVCGESERTNGTVNVRTRSGDQLGEKTPDELIAWLDELRDTYSKEY